MHLSTISVCRTHGNFSHANCTGRVEFLLCQRVYTCPDCISCGKPDELNKLDKQLLAKQQKKALADNACIIHELVASAAHCSNSRPPSGESCRWLRHLLATTWRVEADAHDVGPRAGGGYFSLLWDVYRLMPVPPKRLSSSPQVLRLLLPRKIRTSTSGHCHLQVQPVSTVITRTCSDGSRQP